MIMSVGCLKLKNLQVETKNQEKRVLTVEEEWVSVFSEIPRILAVAFRVNWYMDNSTLFLF